MSSPPTCCVVQWRRNLWWRPPQRRCAVREGKEKNGWQGGRCERSSSFVLVFATSQQRLVLFCAFFFSSFLSTPLRLLSLFFFGARWLRRRLGFGLGLGSAQLNAQQAARRLCSLLGSPDWIRLVFCPTETHSSLRMRVALRIAQSLPRVTQEIPRPVARIPNQATKPTKSITQDVGRHCTTASCRVP